MTIRRFEDIEAWKLARELTNSVYAISGKGAFAKDFELRGQIRAASGSSMHNCAEGFDSGSNAEFARFLRIAQRSCTEVKSQLYLAIDQSYIDQAEFNNLYAQAERTHKAIGGLIRYLVSKNEPATKTVLSRQPRTK